MDEAPGPARPRDRATAAAGSVTRRFGDVNEPAGAGFAALDAIDDVSIYVAPDQATDNPYAPLNASTLSQCENLRDRLAILSIKARQGTQNAANFLVPVDSTFGAVYYPWISVFDPSKNTTVLIPPSGRMAGVYARTDVDRGTHKAPADEVVPGGARP